MHFPLDAVDQRIGVERLVTVRFFVGAHRIAETLNFVKLVWLVVNQIFQTLEGGLVGLFGFESNGRGSNRGDVGENVTLSQLFINL